MEKSIKLICQNPECGKEFYVDKKHVHSKFCCRKCADKVHNKNKENKKYDILRKLNKSNKCENCGGEHDHSYGSGRFCSRECQYKWIGKKSGSILGHTRSAKNNWKCLECGKIFRTRRDKQMHIKECHPSKDNRRWTKGLTKETSETIRKNAESVSKSMKKLYENGYDNPKSPFCKSYWTEERRKERSEQKKNYIPNIQKNIQIENLPTIEIKFHIQRKLQWIG